MESSAKKILLIYNNYSTFVERDYEILSERNVVHRYHFKSSKKFFKLFAAFLKQFFFLLFKGWTYDVFFIWFADYHSFLPVLYAKISQKKCYIVIGGYDVARVKEYSYGAFVKEIRGWFAIQSIKKCTCNIAISQYVNRKIRFIAPSAKRNLIYNAIDNNLLNGIVDKPKVKMVLTVAIVEREQTFYIKGIDTFIECARKIPNIPFVIVGLNERKMKHLLHNTPDNLFIYKKIPHQELYNYFLKAEIYCQLSRSESFSLALAEAMYFNCYPIITNVGGMPEVIGSYGEILPRNAVIIAEQIEKHIRNERKNTNSQNYVKTNFSSQKRAQQLLSLLETI